MHVDGGDVIEELHGAVGALHAIHARHPGPAALQTERARTPAVRQDRRGHGFEKADPTHSTVAATVKPLAA